MTKIWKLLTLLLLLILIVIWLAVPILFRQKLKIIACDVGQGDAIFATIGTTQFLIDGGPGNRVINCISKYMPFWDREIEVVILTHPEKDHYGGLLEVFNHYNVGLFLASPVNSGSQSYEVLKNQVRGKGINVVNTKKGMRIGNNLIYLDILFPTEDFFKSKISGYNPQANKNVLGAYSGNNSLNQYSIVALLSFRNFNALFTGDITSEVSDYLADELVISSKQIPVEYIKIPHHGSRNNLTEDLLSNLNPIIAVISVGKNNSYGHPHAEILKMLKERSIKVLRTDEKGDVVVETDGIKIWIQ